MIVNREEGQSLKKKISSSLIEPTLLGYQDAFTRNANETGWLEIAKAGEKPQWQRRWFELKDGVIRHAPSNDVKDMKESVFIPIENIIRLVTDNKKRQRKGLVHTGDNNDSASEHIITMKTTHEKVYLRAESGDDLNRWVFAFQRSVALAMTKIMMAQAKSSMHHSLGLNDDVTRQRDADEALFLQEAAVNEDDGWDLRRLIRTRNIVQGHTKVINASKEGIEDRRQSRSMSVDDSLRPSVGPQELEKQSAISLRTRTYKDRSFGDLTKIKDDSTMINDDILSNSTPTSPLKLSWGQHQSGLSSADSSPRIYGNGVAGAGSRCSSNSDSYPLSQSAEGIDETWRSVEDMALMMHHDDIQNFKEKMSPKSYGFARTRSNSCGSGSSNSPRKEGLSASSGSASLQGISILPQVSGRRIKSDESIEFDGGEDIFGMDDLDSLENSFEDFGVSGNLSSSYNLRIRFGSCTILGPKSKQEDCFIMAPSLPSPQTRESEVEGYDAFSNSYRCENSYAAVYDGHCGCKASSFVNEKLHNMVYEHPHYDSDIEVAIRDCAERVDQEFLEIARRTDMFDGTTAIGAFFHHKTTQQNDTRSVHVKFPIGTSVLGEGLVENQLTRLNAFADLPSECRLPGSKLSEDMTRVSDIRMTVFNIGDSAAVLCRNGEAISMSDAHCPSRPDEQTRIEAAKGWITEEKELFVGRLHRMDLSDPDIAEQAANGIQWTTIYRVLGEVSVSRSIGDYPYKGFKPGEVVNDFFSWPENHDMTFNSDLVISEPECKHVDIDELCEFVILASDGLWDVVSNDKATARVKLMLENGQSPDEAAKELCDLALKLGTGDNTTVIVIQFLHLINRI